jgi:hypothetical protein
MQVNSNEKPFTSHQEIRKRSLRNSFFSGENLTLEKFKLIIFCEMYK